MKEASEMMGKLGWTAWGRGICLKIWRGWLIWRGWAEAAWAGWKRWWLVWISPELTGRCERHGTPC
jgi:hypothetical protein